MANKCIKKPAISTFSVVSLLLHQRPCKKLLSHKLRPFCLSSIQFSQSVSLPCFMSSTTQEVKRQPSGNRTLSSAQRRVWTNLGMTTDEGESKYSKKVYHIAPLPIRSTTRQVRRLRSQKIKSNCLCKCVYTLPFVLPAVVLGAQQTRALQVITRLEVQLTCRALTYVVKMQTYRGRNDLYFCVKPHYHPSYPPKY